MKAFIDASGYLTVVAENPTESYALRTWWGWFAPILRSSDDESSHAVGLRCDWQSWPDNPSLPVEQKP
jgi:hypothetical protein